jgi:hypothetical protein
MHSNLTAAVLRMHKVSQEKYPDKSTACSKQNLEPVWAMLCVGCT